MSDEVLAELAEWIDSEVIAKAILQELSPTARRYGLTFWRVSFPTGYAPA